MRTALALFLALLFVSIVVYAFPLTVLYTNDLHVRVSRLKSIGEMIDAERHCDVPVLLFDAGDTWQDFRLPLSAVWGVQEMVAWMNGVGYSAMALGNHDLYLNPHTLDAAIAQAEFPVLCANYVSESATSWTPAALLEIDGMRILVVGLITHELLPFGARPHLVLHDAACALRQVSESYQNRYDFLFVVAHISVDRAIRIARSVQGIDVFVSGHSHERTHEPVVEGKTLIVQAGQFGEHLGRLRLDVDLENARLHVVDNTLLPTKTTPVNVRSGVVQLLITVASLLGVAALLLF